METLCSTMNEDLLSKSNEAATLKLKCDKLEQLMKEKETELS